MLLQESNQHNEELLTMRHDMMLTAIKGYADMIEDSDVDGRVKQYGEPVHKSADRMLSLLNSLLNYYRLDTGKDEVEMMPFRVKDVLR